MTPPSPAVIEMKIIQTSDKNDSNDIVWIKNGKRIGFGYQGKEDKRHHVLKCPQCGRENYAIVVAKGPCCWCQFDPNIISTTTK